MSDTKILLMVANANSVHTQNWANGLAKNSPFDIHIFSLEQPTLKYQSVTVHSFDIGKSKIRKFFRFLYSPIALYKLEKIIRPSIVHAHYLSSYGIIGAFIPKRQNVKFIVSTWGTDVVTNPKINYIYLLLTRFVLIRSDCIMATSAYLANECKKYTKKEIHITPFGIDTDRFRSNPDSKVINPLTVTIGTVKSLYPVYGIDVLIKAFAEVVKSHPEISIDLKIAGHGPELKSLKILAVETGVANKIKWVGSLKYEHVPEFLQSIDIFANLSRSESFGVAILEASSCHLPVLATHVGGIPEVCQHQVSGLLVQPNNLEQTTSALSKLINSPRLRKEYGTKGRELAVNRYDWNICLDIMLGHYLRLTSHG